ncbi:MAG: helix-turn-helix transcriptional regulator [Rikenellaceae bacterium]
MRKRLQKIIEQEGLTSAKFAEILAVQPSTISHLLSGRNKPNFEFISRMLVHFPDLNARWLINGDEPMYVAKAEPQDIHNDNAVPVPAPSEPSDVQIDEQIIETEQTNDDTVVTTITDAAVEHKQEEPLNAPMPIAELNQPTQNEPTPALPPSPQQITITQKKATKIFVIYDNGTFAELDRQSE